MAQFALNTGAKIPAVGFGTWKAAPGEAAAAVRSAFEAGYRHFVSAIKAIAEIFSADFQMQGLCPSLYVLKPFNVLR